MWVPGAIRTRLADPLWRHALRFALPAIAIELGLYLYAPDAQNYHTVLLAAIVAGFVYPGERVEAQEIGKRIGAIGSLLIVVPAWTLAGWVVGPALWLQAIVAIFTLLPLGLLALVLVVISMVGGIVGHWLRGRVDPDRAKGVLS